MCERMGSLKQLAGLNIHLLVVASNTSKQLPESVMYKNLKDLLEAQKCEDAVGKYRKPQSRRQDLNHKELL